MEQDQKFLSTYHLPALLTFLSLIPLTTEEITGCTIEEAKGATISQEIHLLVILFHVLLFQ